MKVSASPVVIFSATSVQPWAAGTRRRRGAARHGMHGDRPRRTSGVVLRTPAPSLEPVAQTVLDRTAEAHQPPVTSRNVLSDAEQGLARSVHLPGSSSAAATPPPRSCSFPHREVPLPTLLQPPVPVDLDLPQLGRQCFVAQRIPAARGGLFRASGQGQRGLAVRPQATGCE